MRYIDHHAHMVSRTTDDYQHLALTGCVAVTEPAFWAGWDRSCGDSVEDYFRQLTEFEPKRAALFGVQHYTWLAMNPKESDDRELSREVLKRIPKFLDRPTVLGIGEIGMNRITRNEIATYTEQVELAIEHDQLILIHTPHLEDKLKGTRISLDVLARYRELKPERVMVDHAEEHTIELIRDRICVAGACDWGPSDPIAVPRFAVEMRRRRHADALIERVIFENPVRFLSQAPKFKVTIATPEPARVG